MKKSPGYLVISLDFELFWGMFDKQNIDSYGPQVLGERTAIPRMLALFKKHDIHATWATVGMLMAHDRTELERFLPPLKLRPSYKDKETSAYNHLKTPVVLNDEKTDPYHYGPSLLSEIMKTPHQEIANHTFSHYYCVDGNINTQEVFSADLTAYEKIADTYGLVATSIVFPRNQWTTDALRTCKEHGITAYRGNENHFLYRSRSEEDQTLFVRGLRLLDHYLNLSGHHTYPVPHEGAPINIPASRFFRPFMKRLALLEPLRLRRIKRGMAHAAKRGEVFHLWWHPHNVGINQEENFKNLESILRHFDTLRKRYGMQSASMKDIVSLVSNQ